MRIGRSVNVLGGTACLSDDMGVRAPLHAPKKPQLRKNTVDFLTFLRRNEMAYHALRCAIQEHLKDEGHVNGTYEVLLATMGVTHDNCPTLLEAEFLGKNVNINELGKDEKEAYDIYRRMSDFLEEFHCSFPKRTGGKAS